MPGDAQLAAIGKAVAGQGLTVIGTCAPEAGEPVPDDCRSLALLGPRDADFWPRLTASPEWNDGRPDPVDRWSQRVIGALARDLGATAIFPFGANPPAPFISWALRTGRCWVSPVGLLVHEVAGLWVSFRGALAFEQDLGQPPAGPAPCETCPDKPCLTACPSGALTGRGYDLPACHGFLDTAAGVDCLSAGCAVRRACPLSKTWARNPAQSAHHMRAFHP